MVRGCEYCGAQFSRRPEEKRWRFEMRRYCSHRCYSLDKPTADPVLARVKHVLEYEPDLPLWAICERFGVDHGTARRWVDRFVGRDKRPLLKHHPKPRPPGSLDGQRPLEGIG